MLLNSSDDASISDIIFSPLQMWFIRTESGLSFSILFKIRLLCKCRNICFLCHPDSFPTAQSAFIHRSKRSPKRRGFLRSKMDRKRPSFDEREKGKGRACGLRQVQLKVSDLGLGYRSQEELIFSYCSGVCINSLTNYDKIVTSHAGNGKNFLRSSTHTACCRPVEYDDDLSFLDDNLIYHTMKRHSARKCGCV
uniref:Glial cell derived neurotrophic factor b n=1 Tax=Sinocyclocheilus anshuiensis TaxID=1608454 RepID=A0A671K9I2_9TELE